MKNLNVELLRGILMTWIVLFHYTTRYNELFLGTYSLEFENGGVVGVTFFFVISGYFFWSGILNGKEYSLVDAGKFCINKYWRLYPAYLLSIILIFTLITLFGLSGRECSFKDFIINSLFIYHPSISYVDSAHWFIATLIKLQIFSTFFLLLKPAIRNKAIVLFELFVIGLLLSSNLYNHTLLHKLVFVLSPDCFLKFLIGYNLLASISFQDKTKNLHLCLLVITLGYYCFIIHTLLVPVYAIMTYLILQNKYLPQIKSNSNLLLMIGNYSFTWYLIHQNIGFIIINKLNELGLKEEFWLFIPMTITFGLAIMIQHITNLFPRKLFTK